MNLAGAQSGKNSCMILAFLLFFGAYSLMNDLFFWWRNRDFDLNYMVLRYVLAAVSTVSLLTVNKAHLLKISAIFKG